MTAARLITLSFALLLAAGCGGDDSKATSKDGGSKDADAKATEVDACELLDKGAVADAIGEGVGKVDGTSTGDGSSSCSWYGEDDSKLMQRGVTLIAAPDNGKERWEAHRKLIEDTEDVDGIGDGAFTDGEVIAAWEGDAYVVISPLYNDSGVTTDQVRPLGVAALEQLQDS